MAVQLRTCEPIWQKIILALPPGPPPGRESTTVSAVQIEYVPNVSELDAVHRGGGVRRVGEREIALSRGVDSKRDLEDLKM
jgi:hypothetical protein